jgi:hypothetical protein
MEPMLKRLLRLKFKEEPPYDELIEILKELIVEENVFCNESKLIIN